MPSGGRGAGHGSKLVVPICACSVWRTSFLRKKSFRKAGLNRAQRITVDTAIIMGAAPFDLFESFPSHVALAALKTTNLGSSFAALALAAFAGHDYAPCLMS